MRKEWNITYAIHDGYGGKDEHFIILPAWWKVALWLLTHVHKCCEICIWISWRFDDDT